MIDRRVLANWRADSAVVARWLPAPFEPLLQGGQAVVGVCLIRLKGVRPAWVPGPAGVGLGLGLRSENAAHRAAVRWRDPATGDWQSGVYIPRRDTDSRLNAWAGGRLFPGEHHRAAFDVSESSEAVTIDMRANDGSAAMRVEGEATSDWPSDSVFASVDEASAFFAAGSLGYSATRTPGDFDGLELACDGWAVQPMRVDAVASSVFDDPAVFPPGSIAFDHALLMRGVSHEWRSREPLCCEGMG